MANVSGHDVVLQTAFDAPYDGLLRLLDELRRGDIGVRSLTFEAHAGRRAEVVLSLADGVDPQRVIARLARYPATASVRARDVHGSLGWYGFRGATTAKVLLAALFLGVPLLFAGNMVAARGLSGLVPPATLAFGRWVVVALLLLPVVWRGLRQLKLDRRSAVVLGWTAVLGATLSVAPQYKAATLTSAANIALIFATTPLLVAAVERVFWRVAVPLRLLAGVAVAVPGMALAMCRGDPAALAGMEFNAGDVLALVSAAAWASYTVLLRHRPSGLPPLVTLWCVAAGGVVTLLPFAAMEWAVQGVPVFTMQAIAGVVFVALVAGIGAYLAYGALVKKGGAALASVSMYLVPVYALILECLLLNASVEAYQALALALVLGGVALASGRRRPACVTSSATVEPRSVR